jgi:cytochrome c peroxidase
VREKLYLLILFLAVGALFSGCSSDDDPVGGGGEAEAELTALIRAEYGGELIPLPDSPPSPPDNDPANAGFSERLDLGKQLFYDPILSGNDDVSCAHCHHPGFAWGDGRALSIGVGGVGLGMDRTRTLPPGEPTLEEWEFMTPRNSPTVLDTGYFLPDPDGEPWEGRMFWDGRTFSLEKQARAPLRSRDEMKHDAYGGPDAVTEVCTALKAIPEYLESFKAAFPEDLQFWLDAGFTEDAVINGGTYARAVGAYERELFTADSPFDRFARGEDAALTFSQKRGLVAFFEAGCDACHNGAMFSDFEFYALGVAQGGPGRPPVHEHGDGNDYGRFENSGDDADRYAFRTPTLRNVSITAPYFHTGGEGAGSDYQTLRQVVEFSNRGGNDLGLLPEYLDGPAVPLGLTDQEIDDIVAFLESLTGTRIGSNRINVEVPLSVPSGLDPPAVLEPVLTN